jgi:hypothetical protein
MLAKHFFDPKIALRCAQDNLGVKKVLAPSKNPSKSPIMCFGRIKKTSRTIRNSGALIIITAWIIAMRTAPRRLNLKV